MKVSDAIKALQAMDANEEIVITWASREHATDNSDDENLVITDEVWGQVVNDTEWIFDEFAANVSQVVSNVMEAM